MFSRRRREEGSLRERASAKDVGVAEIWALAQLLGDHRKVGVMIGPRQRRRGGEDLRDLVVGN